MEAVTTQIFAEKRKNRRKFMFYHKTIEKKNVGHQ